MTLQTMMYNGTSGINSMASNMAVLSDNVANLNSVAYKASRATFQDAITSALGAQREVGNGSRLGAVTKPFQIGQFEASSRATDMAIAGRGFFMLRDPLQATTEMYTRDGQFRLAGALGVVNPVELNLVSSQGYFVQGYDVDATGTPGTAIGDIVIRRESPPKATENLTVAMNLQNSGQTEAIDSPLYAAWNGANPAGPLAAADFDYHTIIAAYDDTGLQFDLTLYFDNTANPNEQEFLVTCDPALDRRLIDATTRYTGSETGAGALLYGKLLFNVSGELGGIDCWDVAPDGTLGSQIILGRGEGDYAFAYNVSGSGNNLSCALNFGTDPMPQRIESPGAAMDSAVTRDASYVSAVSLWDQVYDQAGNKVQDGDVITFTGTDGDGNPVSLAYTVDLFTGFDANGNPVSAGPDDQIGNLLTALSNAFNCDAALVDGQLRLTDRVVGGSQLAITSITYQDAAGNTPATNANLAQCFGVEGAAFAVNADDRYNLAAIGTTNYASPSLTLFQQQDGFGTGYLENISVDKHGVIAGWYSNGQQVDQAQLALADFANFEGMELLDGNLFAATDAAGAMISGVPGEGRFGNVQGNTLEMSNVDLGQQFAELVMTQRAFQVNSVSITTANEIYETVLRLK